jgi:hypothetical protein
MAAPEFVSSPDIVNLIELAAHPDALRWAHDCGWVPGTGHCLARDCASECLFRTQREAEARQIVRARRRRRKARQLVASATARLVFAALSAQQLLAGA